MIQLRDVGLRFPGAGHPGLGGEVGGRDGGARHALRGITTTIPGGGFRWLVGPSGAGKTSLLRLLHLAEHPTAGTLSVLGTVTGPGHRPRRRALARLRRRIGMVFQDFRLLEQCTVWENVALPLRLDRRPEAQVRRDVAEMLRWIGLARYAAARPAELSGGEQQRVAIARAVVGRPSVLLADEPTGNLDEVQAERLLGLLREMNRLGATVVIATHNTGLVARHPGPELRLEAGRLVGDDGDG